jgi:hypothetical protein
MSEALGQQWQGQGSKRQGVLERLRELRGQMPDVESLRNADAAAKEKLTAAQAAMIENDWRRLPSGHPVIVAYEKAEQEREATKAALSEAAATAAPLQERIQRLEDWLAGVWDGTGAGGEDADVY